MMQFVLLTTIPSHLRFGFHNWLLGDREDRFHVDRYLLAPRGSLDLVFLWHMFEHDAPQLAHNIGKVIETPRVAFRIKCPHRRAEKRSIEFEVRSNFVGQSFRYKAHMRAFHP